jgi:hypothetical protein
MKEIIVDVSADGEISIESRGFTGKACLEETKFLKDLLGKEIHKQLTPSYYQGKQKTKKYLQLCG